MSLDTFIKSCGYEIEGTWMPRVTTITSIISKPNLARYYAQHPNLMSAQRALDAAADWGTLTHEALESVLQGSSFIMDARVAPSVNSFKEWLGSNPLELIDAEEDIERRVVDAKNRYAGTIDIVAKVDGVVSIIDIKTGSGIWEEHYLQTAAYMNAYNAMVGKRRQAKQRWILRVDQYQACLGCEAKRRNKDGTYRIRGGNRYCNHQWSDATADIEWKELEGYKEDLEAFLSAKEVWEWYHKKMLRKIETYQLPQKYLGSVKKAAVSR